MGYIWMRGGDLFHKVLSLFKQMAYLCTCVLIKCKFWVLVANLFFFFTGGWGGGYPDDCKGNRVVLRRFPSLLQGSIQGCWFWTLFFLCVCVFSFKATVQKKNPNWAPSWNHPISTSADGCSVITAGAPCTCGGEGGRRLFFLLDIGHWSNPRGGASHFQDRGAC